MMLTMLATIMAATWVCTSMEMTSPMPVVHTT